MRNGHSAIAETLLCCKAGVDAAGKDGRTPLHRACFTGQTSVVRTLLARKVCFSLRPLGCDSYDLLKTYLCATFNNAPRILLASQANAERADKSGQSPMQLAVREAHHAAVLALIEGGANSDAVACLDLTDFGLESLPTALGRCINLKVIFSPCPFPHFVGCCGGRVILKTDCRTSF